MSNFKSVGTDMQVFHAGTIDDLRAVVVTWLNATDRIILSVGNIIYETALASYTQTVIFVT